MAEDKVVIENFNGSDFSWWKMQLEALLCQKDLDMVLGDKPEKMEKAAEDAWNSKDKKANAVISLSLTKSVAFNIMNETTARGMMEALSNMYEKPSAANKVFLMRELFTTRMNEEGSVTVHINNLNSILSRLSSVGIKFDNDTQASLLLASLPDSWSGTVTAVTSSVGTSGMTFEGVRDLVLGEDIRRKNQGGSFSSDLLNVGRGRGNSRKSGSSGSRGKSSSRTLKNVKCWNCQEDDALILSMESSVDSWVMDSGASFHAMDNGETMVNLKEGDFGKVRLANDEMLQVTGMGDIDMATSLGTTWSLKNVRVIPELKKKLISVGQLDKQGFMTVPVKQDKIWFAKSTTKRVHFANMNSGAKGMLAERVRKSKPVRRFCDTGSTGRVPGTVTKSRWVLKTKTEKFSIVGSLLSLESVSGPRCISGSGGVSKPVETEDDSVAGLATAELELVGVSTGPSSDFKDLQRFEVNLRKIEVVEGKKSPSIYKKFVFDVEGRNPKSKSDEIEGLVEQRLEYCKNWRRKAVQTCEHGSCHMDTGRVTLGHGSCPMDTGRVQCPADFEYDWIPYESLLEKAYAKLHGFHETLEGGLVQDALVDLTGGAGEEIDMRSARVQIDLANRRLWSQLLRFKQGGFLLGAGNPSGSDVHISSSRIVQGHAYSLLQVREVDGHKFVQIRNQWANEVEWSEPWSDSSFEWTDTIKHKLKHVPRTKDEAFIWVIRSIAKRLGLVEQRLEYCKNWRRKAVQTCEHGSCHMDTGRVTLGHGSCPMDTGRVQCPADFEYDWIPYESLLEKAYAKLHGFHETLEGGLVQDALVDLTGGAGEEIDMRSARVQIDLANRRLWSQLLRFKQGGFLLGAGNPSGSDVHISSSRIVQGHAYSLLQVREVDGHKFVQIRNQWANEVEWSEPWSDSSFEWTDTIKHKLKHVPRTKDEAFIWVIRSIAKRLGLVEQRLEYCKNWRRKAVQTCEHGSCHMDTGRVTLGHGSCPMDTGRVQCPADFECVFMYYLSNFNSSKCNKFIYDEK
ncbi:hypothetical protein LXL04_010033 [Taraxacum kok-saghyz]